MRHRRFRITQADFILANRKAAREEEIREHGKELIFRSSVQKSKKVYDRKRLKRADIADDDCSFYFFSPLCKFLNTPR